MLNGNWYGLVITLLTLVIAVILTVRHVSDNGIRFEVVIQPVPMERPNDDRKRQITGGGASKQNDQELVTDRSQRLAATPGQQVTR